MRLICLITFILASLPLWSQKLVKGRILDQHAQAVFAANVYWEKHPQLGVTSNFQGEFSIALPKSGEPEFLIISFIGFKSKSLQLSEIKSKEFIEVRLESASTELQSVTVVGRDPISERFSVLKMEKLDVYLNPVSSGDPLKAITFLPSSTNTDEMANPAIRGSNPDKSRVLLNGVPVLKPVRNSQINGIGNFSLFNTEIIHKQYVYASNPPLTYGNTSAGMVEIETVRSLDKNTLQISNSLANIGLFFSKKINEKSLIQVYGNRQFSDFFLDVNRKSMEKLNEFKSVDAGVNLKLQVSKNVSINTFNYMIDEHYDVDSYQFAHRNQSIADNQRLISISNLHVKTRQGLLSTNIGYDITDGKYRFGNLYSKNKNRILYASVNFKHQFNEKLQAQVGIKEAYKHYQFNDSVPQYYYNVAPDAPNFYQKTTLDQHHLETYLFGSYQLSGKWLWSVGVRSNIPVDDQKDYWSMQSSLKYAPDEIHSLLLSAGKYHSYSTPNYYLPDFSLNRSYQLALDYDISLRRSSVHAAIYYKEDHGNWRNTNYMDFNDSRVFGLEFGLQQMIGKHWRVNCSNIFLRQEVKGSNHWYKGNQDLDYFVKASLGYNHPKIVNVNATFMARPGLRYTPILRAEFKQDANAWQPYFDTEINRSRYSDYQNLSVTVNRMFPIGKQSVLLFWSATNILNKKNQESIEYNQDYTFQSCNYYGRRVYYFGFVLRFR